MATPNNLAAERWHLPPVEPQPGAYWLTVDSLADGRRFVTREDFGPLGWPEWLRLPRFKLIAFMRADEPAPYLF